MSPRRYISRPIKLLHRLRDCGVKRRGRLATAPSGLVLLLAASPVPGDDVILSALSDGEEARSEERIVDIERVVADFLPCGAGLAAVDGHSEIGVNVLCLGALDALHENFAAEAESLDSARVARRGCLQSA